MSKLLVTTEKGTVYKIKPEKGLWKREAHPESHNPSMDHYEQMWSLQIGDEKAQPDVAARDWPLRDIPEIGKHMFIASKDSWFVSRKVVSIEEEKEKY